MELPQKVLTRLTSTQKKLIDTLDKNNINSLLEQFTDHKYENINSEELKKYNVVYDYIENIITELKLEPHEIYTLLNSYSGENKTCKILKKFIIDRNIYIIKNVYRSKSWQKQINEFFNIFDNMYNGVTIEIIDKIIVDMLYDNINLFDIAQIKLTLNDKFNLKKINLNLNDQKHIITQLLTIGCTKKVKK